MAAPAKATSTVFIGNLPFEASEESLQSVFEAVGPIKSIRFPRDAAGKHKGFGFCEYFDSFAAESAVRNLNGHDLNGRPLRVSYAEENISARGSGAPEADRRGDDRGGPRERRPVPGDRERVAGGERGLPGDGRGPVERGPAGGPAPYAAAKGVGPALAGSAAASLNAWMGAPPYQGLAQAHVNSKLGEFTAAQLFELMSQMRSEAQQNPGHVRAILIANPQLTKALFQVQIMLGMVQPPPAPNPPPAQPALAPAPVPMSFPMQAAVQAPVTVTLQTQPGAPHAAPQTVILQTQQGMVYGLPQGYAPAPNVVQVPQPVLNMPPQLYLHPAELPQQPQMQHIPQPAPAMQQPALPPAAAPVASLVGEHQALLAQVITMSQETIDALPEGTRQQVMAVKQLLVSQGVKM